MWGTFRGAFVALTFVVAATGLAATKHSKIVLSAERDIHGFQAQQALVYGEDSLTFSRNSNFLCAPSDEVLLGVFHAPYEGERETERKYVEEIAARLPAGPASAAPARNPHGVKYFIGPRELVGRDANARTVERIVSEACDDPAPDLKGGWSAERGVAVRHERNDGKDVLRVTELAGADKGKSTVVSFKKAGCTQRGKDRWECPIATHGLVTFAVKR